MNKIVEIRGTEVNRHHDVSVQSSRRLGYIESVMAVMQKEMRGTTLLTQVVHLRGEISYSSVCQAAKQLFEQFAILRCSVVEADSALDFAELLSFDEVPIRHFSSDAIGDWERIFAEEVDTPLQRTLWRLTLISSPGTGGPKIVIATNHAIIDSVAIRVLTTQFLLHLDRAISGKDFAKLSYPIALPIDSYLKSPRNEVVNNIPRSHIPFKHFVPLEERRTRWVVEVLNEVELRGLKDKCAQGKVKIHSVLSAALCLAAYREGLANSPVPLRTAVSLRIGDLNRQDEKELSCCISVADTPINISAGDEIKELASMYDEVLFRQIATNCLNRKNVDIGAISKFATTLKTSEAFVDGFAITTVEEPSDLPNTYANFEVDDFAMIVNRSAGNFAVGLQVTIQHGEMRFIFVYPDPLWDEGTVRTLSAAFIRLLTEF